MNTDHDIRIRVRPKDFRPGDILVRSGHRVIGIDAFVRGGVRIAIEDVDGGDPVVIRFNGRYLHDVTRAS
jgi:hypothetical protein